MAQKKWLRGRDLKKHANAVPGLLAFLLVYADRREKDEAETSYSNSERRAV